LDKLDDRGFARARRADKGHRFTRRDVQCHPVQRNNIGTGRISKMHILKGDQPFNRLRQRRGIGRILHCIFGLQQLDQTFCGTGGPLQFAPDL
jgi:hypothetical protein